MSLLENRQAKRLLDFVTGISKLKAAEFCGVCKIMGVAISDEKEEEMRPLEDIMNDLMDSFLKMKKKPRQELMKMLGIISGK